MIEVLAYVIQVLASSSCSGNSISYLSEFLFVVQVLALLMNCGYRPNSRLGDTTEEALFIVIPEKQTNIHKLYSNPNVYQIIKIFRSVGG